MDPEISEEEFKMYLDEQAHYLPIPFRDPIEMLEVIYAGGDSIFTNPWDWQKEEQLRLANTKCSKDEPYRLVLSANNGAGKDSMINAPWSVFQAMCKVRSRTVITTSSYTQLQLQTEAYVRTIANRANVYLASQGITSKLFVIKKQHLIFVPTGSEIVLFVTDDGGRAEGYHPFPDAPKGEVTIIINEAKSVPDLIFEHLSRCTFSRWIEISSPGGMTGKHYKHIREAQDSNNEYPNPYSSANFYARRVTSYDCPHISVGKIESDRIEYGENSAIFRSKHLALFTSLDEQVVINQETIQQCLLFPHAKIENLGLGRRAGLDLAKGGDENVLCIVEENEVIGMEIFRAKDTAEVTVPVLVDFFKKWKLEGDNIYGDDGGVGGAILDNIRRAGYHINRILMQSPPSQRGGYGNLGAELWFRFGQIAPYLRLPKDNQKLISQLTSRFYKQNTTTGKLILEAKADARAKGHSSPDRADALVLAYVGVTVHLFHEKLGIEVGNGSIKRKMLSVQEALDLTGKRLTLPNDYVAMSAAIKSKDNGRVRITNPGKLLRSLYN